MHFIPTLSPIASFLTFDFFSKSQFNKCAAESATLGIVNYAQFFCFFFSFFFLSFFFSKIKAAREESVNQDRVAVFARSATLYLSQNEAWWQRPMKRREKKKIQFMLVDCHAFSSNYEE